MSDKTLQRRKAATVTIAMAVVAAMVGFAFASAPLYRIICRAIGANGTTQVATAAPRDHTQVPVTIRFDANVDKGLPWEFKPNQKSVTTMFGETATVSYHAKNTSDRTIVGTATFNVTPEKIGQYFNKIECFCFSQQTLAPGEEADLAVTFFVDPDLLKDKSTEEVRTITLSYTFFPSANEAPADEKKTSAAKSISLVPSANAAPAPAN